MPRAEALERLTICGRIFDAWPNARPLNRDRTVIEYVNATRGVPLDRLGHCIQLAIEAGGEFIPPAGEVLKRAAAQALGGHPVGTDRDAIFWHEKRVAETVSGYTRMAEKIAPLRPDVPLESQPTQPRLSA